LFLSRFSYLIRIKVLRPLSFPTQVDAQLGIRLKSGSGVYKEAVSIDQEMALPIQSSQEMGVSDEMPIPETVAIALIISFIVRDIIDSIQISIGNIV
jgi:hypothetical protein